MGDTVLMADCTQIEKSIREFQQKNKKNQEANLNFLQQVSDRLRAAQAGIVDDVKTQLEAMENKSTPPASLSSKEVVPVVLTSLAPMTTMADETDGVLNAAYDNNETVSNDLDALVTQIQDCLPKGPVKN